MTRLEPQRRMRISDVGPLADGLAGVAAVYGVAQQAASAGKFYAEITPEHWAALIKSGFVNAEGWFSPILRGAARRSSNTSG